VKLIFPCKIENDIIRREDPVELQIFIKYYQFIPKGLNKLVLLDPYFWLGWPRRIAKPPKKEHTSILRSTVQSACGKMIQYIWSTNQATPGITAQSHLRVLIDGGVYDLDVGSGHPDGATAIKGSFVQRLTVLRDLSSDRSNPGRFLSITWAFSSTKGPKRQGLY